MKTMGKHYPPSGKIIDNRLLGTIQERTSLNLLKIYINEVIGATQGKFDGDKASTERNFYFIIDNKKIILKNVKQHKNGILYTIGTAYLESGGNIKKLSSKEILRLLKVTKTGRRWFKNNTLNLFHKNQLDKRTQPLNWKYLLYLIQNNAITRSYFFAIAEQYNPSYERHYHPLPHLQEGDLRYSAYFAKALFSYPENPLIGAYPLLTSSELHNPYVITSEIGKRSLSFPKTLFVHPQNIPYLNNPQNLTMSNVYFAPFSSIRSGFILQKGETLTDNTFQIKLDYIPRVTSRTRKIPLEEHMHAIQINNALEKLIQTKKLTNIGFLPDLYAIADVNNTELSYRIRASLNNIYPTLPNNIILFPSFALYYFSKAVEQPLIIELMKLAKIDTIEYLRERIVTPILHSFFTLAFEYGLIHESHGQNILLAYDLENHRINTIILRDLESTIVNEAQLYRYNGIINPKIQEINHTPMNFFCKPEELKEKVSKRLDHWVIQVHIEPILQTISLFQQIPMDMLYKVTRDVIKDWWIRKGAIDRIHDDLELGKYYLRNYLFTNTISPTVVKRYTEYGKPFFSPSV